MILDERNASEEIAHEHEQAHPRDATDRIEEREAPERHVARTGDEGRERAEERHEARDDDGETAKALEEVVEFGHALGSERLHLTRIDDALAEEAGNPVVRRIAENSRHVEHDERHPDVEPAAICREHACGEEQRIARKEREEHDARLDEDDEEQGRVHPHGTERDDPAGDCAARILQQIDEEIDNPHGVLR